MNFFRRNFPFLLMAALFVLFALISLFSEGYYGGADNISHYFISRFSFKYPHLFLDSWGRPLYTILSAPFAQFGLHGSKMLNILLGISTAALAWRIARNLGFQHPVGALIFVCFTPLCFIMMPTALTEILFSFMLLLAVLLFINEKYTASAILISFLPFARSEGFILLPLFLLAFLYVRRPKAIPYLASGILFFSIAGSFYYQDLLWVFHQFPYPVINQHPVYTLAGSPWHFVKLRDFILGLPLEILFIAGTVGMVRDIFSSDPILRKNTRLLGLLIFLPFTLYFAFHSFLYWKAMGGSVGLERVIAAVLPLAALVALKGFCDLVEMLKPFRYLQVLFVGFIFVAIIITPFLTYPVPYPLSPEEATIKKATAWLKASPWSDRFLFFTDNNVPYYIGADPFKKKPAECFAFGDCKYLDTIPAGSILVWDAHFGANESKVPIDSLLANSRQKVINYFRPDKPWITLGGGFYDCYITVTLENGEAADNYAIRDSIKELLDGRKSRKILYLNTFENPVDAWDPTFISPDTVHRGKMAFRMDGRSEFSPGFTQPGTSLQLKGDSAELKVSVYVNLPQILPKINTLLVISFEHENKPYSYTSTNLDDMKLRPGKWNRVTLSTPVPKSISPQDIVKVYIWNPGKQVFYLDDFKVEMVTIK